MLTIAPISQQIWDMKYRLKAADGAPVDGSVEGTWARVAKALAGAEADDVAPGGLEFQDLTGEHVGGRRLDAPEPGGDDGHDLTLA